MSQVLKSYKPGDRITVADGSRPGASYLEIELMRSGEWVYCRRWEETPPEPPPPVPMQERLAAAKKAAAEREKLLEKRLRGEQ
jgi:hypothetical protein